MDQSMVTLEPDSRHPLRDTLSPEIVGGSFTRNVHGFGIGEVTREFPLSSRPDAVAVYVIPGWRDVRTVKTVRLASQLVSIELGVGMRLKEGASTSIGSLYVTTMGAAARTFCAPSAGIVWVRNGRSHTVINDQGFGAAPGDRAKPSSRSRPETRTEYTVQFARPGGTGVRTRTSGVGQNVVMATFGMMTGETVDAFIASEKRT